MKQLNKYYLEDHAPVIPDGKTVEPTDDIQIWIKCAGRKDLYTSLADVLADSVCLAALMADDNAVDYLVRSTTWTTMCANVDAMTDIGLNNYCANTLLANSTWLTAICNSVYFESVLNVKVPTMTSNNTPEGECFMDTPLGGGQIYQAFDGNDSTYAMGYQAGGPASGSLWIGYTFVNPMRLVMCRAYTRVYSYYSGFVVQSGNTKSELASLTAISTTGIGTKDVKSIFLNCEPRTTYRAILYETHGAAGSYFFPDVTELQFYGRKDI